MGKVYTIGEQHLEVLRGVDRVLAPGDTASIVRASGAGKSTLLHVLGTLDLPTSGTVRINGTDIGRMAPGPLSAFRNREIGFVFQFHHLLPEFTALENVM